ncbi:hypothetical protein FPSE_09907 [Fusarium pseudograminearum CS3096]|uniref:Uncharacterized protein n=1 Tax=Fusarium pseudograminearum (strain CS3096) TaxID=1028729 RepID=K3V968_FUSPC|nr:hypothetical protein FPSE_09907 [Fusarium pseudograminearum CS3096]EKJ69884.1 hypothetical protein FPSE_09907 [Fusarium pseudograminearum CS3096]
MVPKTSFGALSLLLLQFASGNENENAERTQPDLKYAEDRAHMVFNEIHSAGRLWGSSLYHNGFGFFPATVPAGTMLYHGSQYNVTPSGLEWLAFDIEHSENFARSFRLKPGEGPPPSVPLPDKDKSEQDDGLLSEGSLSEELRRRSERSTRENPPIRYNNKDEDVNIRGYLHLYQTTRDLNLLLIDGMSAGKTHMGTLDSQDLVLRANKDASEKMGERSRARELCELAAKWGLDGFVRMEIGVEVIKCDFRKDLDLVNVMRTEVRDDIMEDKGMDAFQWIRAVAERYDGIGADRLRIDFSSMISGLFFPINISNTNPKRPDLKRLGAATPKELNDIKVYLKGVLSQPRRYTVNWQGVVDLIVSRYSRRIALMAYKRLPSHYFINEVEGATMTWYDAPTSPDDATLTEEGSINRTADAIEECRVHYLRPALLVKEKWSMEDRLIHASLETVLGTICNTLYSVRRYILQASERDGDHDAELEKAVQHGRVAMQELMGELGWTTWRKPQACAPDELSVIAMWPFGTKEDHWDPGCRSIDTVQHPNGTYWDVLGLFN